MTTIPQGGTQPEGTDSPKLAEEPASVSDESRRDAGLSNPELWSRYFELGGMSTPDEVESYLGDNVEQSNHDHDVLAQALNERFSELGSERSVGYLDNPSSEGTPSRSDGGGGVALGLLGSFTLQIGTQPVPVPLNSQRLIAYLALADGAMLRQHVSGFLWGDTTEQRASGSLRSALWRLGHPRYPLVETVDSKIRLSESVAVDLHESRALAGRILDERLPLQEADIDLALLERDLLPDWTEEWVLIERTGHTQVRLRALEALCGRLRALGRFGQAVQAGILAVSIEPLRESAQRCLVKAHLADGNVAAAVDQYRSFRTLLGDELDLAPSPEMQSLVQDLNP